MKTKNSNPSSEFQQEDECPSCGSPCDINSDLDDNDECNDCRNEIDGLEMGQRMYSEKEVINALHSVELKYNRDFTKIYEGVSEYLKELKNK
jgi:hypothetical protein